MSDDRIFASNGAIGRKWYFINLLILLAIFFFTVYFFNNLVYPTIKSDSYKSIAVIMHYFVYIIYLITFFSLIDRRLYDIAGARDKSFYKIVSGFMTFVICFQLLIVILMVFSIPFIVPPASLQPIATILDLIFLAIVLVITFIKGKISTQSYSDYKKQDKFDK